jgi:hypothetical protein
MLDTKQGTFALDLGAEAFDVDGLGADLAAAIAAPGAPAAPRTREPSHVRPFVRRADAAQCKPSR